MRAGMSDESVCRGVVTRADRERKTMLVALEGGGTAAAWALNPLDVGAGDALSGALRARGIRRLRNETRRRDVFALFADGEAALACTYWPSAEGARAFLRSVKVLGLAGKWEGDGPVTAERLSRSVAQPRTLSYRHHRRLHQRHDFAGVRLGLWAFPHRDQLARAHGERPPRPDHSPHRSEACSGARRKQVHLELDAEHGSRRWHQGQRGVPAGAVDHRRGRSGVQEAVLLREISTEWEVDDHVTRLNRHELGSEGRHEGLTCKARADSRVVVGVLRVEAHRCLPRSIHDMPGAMMNRRGGWG